MLHVPDSGPSEGDQKSNGAGIPPICIVCNGIVSLLLQASERLGKNGVLVYAVCSNMITECEEVVLQFLEKSDGQFVRHPFAEDEGPGEALLSPPFGMEWTVFSSLTSLGKTPLLVASPGY